jgi:hypothetical protein
LGDQAIPPVTKQQQELCESDCWILLNINFPSQVPCNVEQVTGGRSHLSWSRACGEDFIILTIAHQVKNNCTGEITQAGEFTTYPPDYYNEHIRPYVAVKQKLSPNPGFDTWFPAQWKQDQWFKNLDCCYCDVITVKVTAKAQYCATSRSKSCRGSLQNQPARVGPKPASNLGLTYYYSPSGNLVTA